MRPAHVKFYLGLFRVRVSIKRGTGAGTEATSIQQVLALVVRREDLGTLAPWRTASSGAKSVEDRTVFQRSAAGGMRPGTRLNNVYAIERLIA